MRRCINTPRTNRRGSILPFVLVALATIALLAGTFASTSWHAVRSANLAARATRAQAAADEGIARAIARWPADSLTSTAIGITRMASAVTSLGTAVDLRFTRTHPLAAWIEARVVTDGVAQGVTRGMQLVPPLLPVDAAVLTSGAVEAHGTTTITHALAPFDAAHCAPVSSTPPTPVVAWATRADTHGAWTPLPTSRAPPGTWRAQLDAAWPRILARSATRALATLPVLEPATGWTAAQLPIADSVIIGPIGWRGLLIAPGPLTIDGDVTMTGVLMVRGPLTVRSGRLTVRGTVIIDDGVATTVQLGGSSVIRMDACATSHALAIVAVPRLHPFSSWHTVTW